MSVLLFSESLNKPTAIFKSLKPLLVFPLLNLLVWYVIYWITYSLITFLVIKSGAPILDAVDILKEYNLFIASASSFFTAAILLSSFPINSESWQAFRRFRFTGDHTHSANIGFILSLILIGALMLTRKFSFWGFLFQGEDLLAILMNTLSRIGLLAGFFFSQEYVFRAKLLPRVAAFTQNFFKGLGNRGIAAISCMATALIQIAVFSFHLDLHHYEWITQFLIGTIVSLWVYSGKHFSHGALTLTVFATVVHVMSSSAILGAEFSGFLTMKPLAEVSRLSGGSHGPLASLVAIVIAGGIAIRLLFRKRNPSLLIRND